MHLEELMTKPLWRYLTAAADQTLRGGAGNEIILDV